MIDKPRYNVLGVRVDAVDCETAVARITEAAKANRSMAVSALAVHGVMTGVFDGTHRHRLNSLDLVVPDGQPVRWALNRLHGARLADRVYGPTLMLELCRSAASARLPIFLYGSTTETLDALEKNLKRRFPSLRIAGTRASRFRRLTPQERDETVTAIRGSGARLVFAGLGCPRQEVWAYEFREALSMPIIAVGAAFPFHAGILPQAPRFMQDRGLEWLFRLYQEPRRLWKRYLLLNPLYLSLLAMQITRLRRFDSNSEPRPSGEILYG